MERNSNRDKRAWPEKRKIDLLWFRLVWHVQEICHGSGSLSLSLSFSSYASFSIALLPPFRSAYTHESCNSAAGKRQTVNIHAAKQTQNEGELNCVQPRNWWYPNSIWNGKYRQISSNAWIKYEKFWNFPSKTELLDRIKGQRMGIKWKIVLKKAEENEKQKYLIEKSFWKNYESLICGSKSWKIREKSEGKNILMQNHIVQACNTLCTFDYDKISLHAHTTRTHEICLLFRYFLSCAFCSILFVRSLME